MDILHVETSVHGRILHEPRSPERLLVGFHGYGEGAEAMFEELGRIPGTEDWSMAAIQALHPFYTRAGDVVANWMTRQDRELAVDDNLAYVRKALASLPRPRKLVFLGFSQGATMAARAAAYTAHPDGLILLGGDIPPEIHGDPGVILPPVLLSRGTRDDWYTDEKLKKDLSFLEGLVEVTSCVFDGAHEWSDPFRNAAADFLRRYA